MLYTIVKKCTKVDGDEDVNIKEIIQDDINKTNQGENKAKKML